MKSKPFFKKYLFSLLLLLSASFCIPQTAFAVKKPAMVRSLKCGTTTKNSINISWKPQNGISGYQIFRSASYDGPYEKLKDVTAENCSFCNINLQSGREYYYRVRAYKTDGNYVITGNFSNALSAHTKCTSRTAALRARANVRKHAGINHPVITTLNTGSKVTVICTANDKSGASWSRISFKTGRKKKIGYIRSDLLSTGQQTPEITGIVIANSGLHLRRSASVSGQIITTLSRGTKISIVSQITGSDGQKWYQVRFKQGKKTLKGYVLARYIRIS
ncbi:hypothetical protein D3Z36_12455 [Lachnospiraceae bacterium]|nr:hypothetical protein [Lachnospiraceae bacterium]